jgi:hypothetical protein
MNNGDMPANPNKHDMREKGLTKREHFAAMAMQGMVNSDTVGWKNWDTDLAEGAVMAADALLAALDNQQGE